MLVNYKNHNIFAFSDTHGDHHWMQISKEADIIICVGDAIEEISEESVSDFMSWFSSIPASLRIFVPGNHDLFFDLYPNKAKDLVPKNVVWLENNGIVYDGIYFYSFSARPWLHGKEEISSGIDFLLTHGPAYGCLDNGRGCSLLRQVIEDGKVKNHIFGHIHECGCRKLQMSETTFYNVSVYDELLKDTANII